MHPRRAPPTPLRLVTGPLPARGKPRHTLPSIPRPAFNPAAHVVQTGPVPRSRASAPEPVDSYMTPAQLLPFMIPMSRGYSSGSSSPTSAGSGSSDGDRSRSPSPAERMLRKERTHSRSSSTESSRSSVHSRSASMSFDISTILAPPRPAAINPAPVW
ncbi:hypothetical protein B0H21DRAFT_285987 [Amylocystis lapponica]|nr:hypothetical protein B0H21DRAFT_285987 [Amylocystis lapponica]